MNKQVVQDSPFPEKRKNDVRENYKDIIEKIVKEYKWESDEIDRVRELQDKIKKMILNKDDKL